MIVSLESESVMIEKSLKKKWIIILVSKQNDDFDCLRFSIDLKKKKDFVLLFFNQNDWMKFMEFYFIVSKNKNEKILLENPSFIVRLMEKRLIDANK